MRGSGPRARRFFFFLPRRLPVVSGDGRSAGCGGASVLRTGPPSVAFARSGAAAGSAGTVTIALHPGQRNFLPAELPGTFSFLAHPGQVISMGHVGVDGHRRGGASSARPASASPESQSTGANPVTPVCYPKNQTTGASPAPVVWFFAALFK